MNLRNVARRGVSKRGSRAVIVALGAAAIGLGSAVSAGAVTDRVAAPATQASQPVPGCFGETCSVTFNSDGATVQSWTPPVGVTQANFQVDGAPGGSGSLSGPAGGSGAEITTTLDNLSPNTPLTVSVGGAGGAGSAGVFGGGAPAAGTLAGGGGGYTEVAEGANPLIIAGGGGGAGLDGFNASDLSGSPDGGAGGSAGGTESNSFVGSVVTGEAGDQGGTLTGSGCTLNGGAGGSGADASAGVGGPAGQASGCGDPTANDAGSNASGMDGGSSHDGGGGGGGYTGGGGGGDGVTANVSGVSDSSGSAGGGSGSSYYDGSAVVPGDSVSLRPNESATGGVTITYHNPVGASNGTLSVVSGATATANLGVLTSVAIGASASYELEPGVVGVSHGTLSLKPNGDFSYTSDAGYTGDDSFVYQVTDSSGDSAAGVVTIDVTPGPGAPTGVTVKPGAAGSGDATVSFVPPSSTGGEPITSYTVTATPTTGSSAPVTATGSGSPITVTGLTPGSRYDIAVTATNSLGTGPAGDASAAVVATAATPPKITVTLSSKGRLSARGWWDAPVTVTFHCTAGTFALSGACPHARQITSNGVTHLAAITIKAKNGQSATLAKMTIRVDRTHPVITLTGVRPGGVYNGKTPTPRCDASDRYSGIASCTVTHKSNRLAAGRTQIIYTATAVSGAGLKSRKVVRVTVNR
jgi:Fibronectin type III domain/Bacterial Ig domain